MADSSSASSANQPERGLAALKQHVIEHKISCGLWALRLLAMLFTLFYFIPLFGNPYNIYYKVLICNSAINALRLHQRMPPIQFTSAFFAELSMEDSFHYLFYASVFLYASPIALVLLPIFLFALLHFASYSLTLLDCLGQNRMWAWRLMISLVEFQSGNILRFIAMIEIILLPISIFLVFSGRAGLLTPFIYYHFLSLRLKSRRNPYTRNVFYEIRNAISAVAAKPSVPAIIRRLLTYFLQVVQVMEPVRQQ
ncbi:Krueppel homolog 2 [Belonocnema kinseyi]|uniref:Krueppel homolog 2 n=1 Tax=Belonocnema kinseyi TaxID=2817044 RepID=UPI00143D7347|nr:Krueppel homolog 2 [Belonocnema kinseyi]XP_033222427.1 Krueppel homolog 2 [Belonocnema kinseyi]